MLDLNALMALYQSQQVSPLAQSYATNFNNANYANEARYGDIVTGLTGLYNRNMDRITSLGDQERADINRRGNQLTSSLVSDAVNRGYGASTVRDSQKRRGEEDRQRNLSQFRDQEIMRQINTDASLANPVYALMERRNDVAPDMGQLAALQQGLGASGMNGYMMPGGISNYGPGSGGAGMAGRVPQAGGYQVPQYGNAAGISHMGPGSGGAGSSVGRPPAMGGYGGVSNMGPGSGGAGGMTPSYPLPGGGMTTPLPLPSVGGGYQMPQQSGMRSMRNTNSVQGALENALISQLNASAAPQQRMGGGGYQAPMLRTAGDLNGGDTDMNKAAWQNQQLSFGGRSVGHAVGIQGAPISMGSYTSTPMYGGGGYGGGNYGGYGGYQMPRARGGATYQAPVPMSAASRANIQRMASMIGPMPGGDPGRYGYTLPTSHPQMAYNGR